MFLDMTYKHVDELYTTERATRPVSLKVIVELSVVFWFHERLVCEIHKLFHFRIIILERIIEIVVILDTISSFFERSRLRPGNFCGLYLLFINTL